MSGTPRLPHRPRQDRSSRNAGTYSALAALVFVSLLLLGLISMVLPQIRAILLIVGGFTGFVVLHYLTWGRWMSRQRDAILNAEREAAERAGVPFDDPDAALPVPPPLHLGTVDEELDDIA